MALTSAQLQVVENDTKIIIGRPALFKSNGAGYIPMDRVLWFFSGPYIYSTHEIEGYNSEGTGWEATSTYWSKTLYHLAASYEDAFDRNRMFKLSGSEWNGFLSCEKLDIANPEHFKLLCKKLEDDRYLIEMKGTVIYDVIKKGTLDGSPFEGLQIVEVFAAYFDALKTIKGVSDATIRRHKEGRDKSDEFKGVIPTNIPKIMKKREDTNRFSCAINNTKTNIRDAERTIQEYHQKIQDIQKNIEDTEKEIAELKKSQ